ncbi:uncharacterized protein LOC144664216 [Oculina patagonica]
MVVLKTTKPWFWGDPEVMVEETSIPGYVRLKTTMADSKLRKYVSPEGYIIPERLRNGAGACVQLQSYEDAINWCDKGLAIDRNSKTLLDLWTECMRDQNKPQETKVPEMKRKLMTHTVKDQERKAFLPIMSKDASDKTEEGTWYGDVANANDNIVGLNDATQYLKQTTDVLGIDNQSLGDLKTTIDHRVP